VAHKGYTVIATCPICGIIRSVRRASSYDVLARCLPCGQAARALRRPSDVGYIAAHAYVRRVRGNATTHSCVDCQGTAEQWSYNWSDPCPEQLTDERGMEYSLDPGRYQPRCASCHMRFDKSRITKCPRGHPYAGDNLLIDAGKRKCRTCVYARNQARQRDNPPTPEQRARKAELQRQRRSA
jgi:hypothetical protein